MTKRIVVELTSGLRMILGALDVEKGDEYPAAIHDVQYGHHRGSVHHHRTFPRYVLYKEFAALPSGSFNDFHPLQA